MTKRSIGPKVTEKYFGMSLMDAQSADEPYDPNSKIQTKDGVYKTGRGSQGGGSKPSNRGVKSGSAALGSSRPRLSQKLRG